MGNEDQLKILRQGTDTWNKWRTVNSDQVDLSEACLLSAKLSEANLRGANFVKANLRGADLRKADLSEADLRKACLFVADLSGAKLIGARLVGAKFYGADLRGADLSEANLCEADLSGAKLIGAKLSEANLSKAKLNKATLSGTELRKAILAKAILYGAYLIGANLSEADLSEADLNEAKILDSDLRKANLSKANLGGVALCKTNLSKAILSGADLRGANLRGADLSKVDLSGADLQGAVLIETNLERANLTGCKVYGISAWNLKLNGAKQNNLIITKSYEPAISVDSLEVAQFIYLLLNHKKIRDVIKSVTERGVLILGRFGDGGLEVLQSIAAKLREMEYLPIIFDFDRPDDKNYTETVKTLVGLSRFVVADLSGPSVPHELYATVPHFKIPFIPVIEESRTPYSMHKDILEYPWVLSPVVEFKDKEHLIELIPSRVIEPAERMCKERQDKLDHLFNS